MAYSAVLLYSTESDTNYGMANDLIGQLASHVTSLGQGTVISDNNPSSNTPRVLVLQIKNNPHYIRLEAYNDSGLIMISAKVRDLADTANIAEIFRVMPRNVSNRYSRIVYSENSFGWLPIPVGHSLGSDSVTKFMICGNEGTSNNRVFFISSNNNAYSSNICATPSNAYKTSDGRQVVGRIYCHLNYNVLTVWPLYAFYLADYSGGGPVYQDNEGYYYIKLNNINYFITDRALTAL